MMATARACPTGAPAAASASAPPRSRPLSRQTGPRGFDFSAAYSLPKTAAGQFRVADIPHGVEDFQIADARIVGDKHLKMQLRVTDRADGEPIEAIAFGYLGGAAEDPRLRSGAKIQAAYRLEVNEYRGVERVQLNCQHFSITQTIHR